MAFTYSNDKFEVGTVISGASVRVVQKEFDILPGIEFPLLSKIRTGAPTKFNDAQKVEWIKDEMLPHTITLNEALDASETDVDVASGDGEKVQVGQVIKIEDELMRVSSIATDTLTVERDYAGSTAATHATGLTIYLMSPTYLDDAQFTQGVSAFGDFEYNYWMYTHYKIAQTIPSTAHSSYLTKGQTEMDFTLMKQRIHRQRLLERQVLYGRRQQPTASATGSMNGIFAYLSTNVSTVSGALDLGDINEVLNDMADHDPNVPKTIIGNRTAKRIFNGVTRQYFDVRGDPMTNEVGVTVERVKLDLGTFDWLTVDSIAESDEMLILNMEDIELLPADTKEGSGWMELTRTPAITDAWQEERVGLWMGSLKVGNEKRHGRLTGFSTDLTQYPLAV